MKTSQGPYRRRSRWLPHSRACSSRFILNLPEVELNSLERVCFQIEQASVNAVVVPLCSQLTVATSSRHWYYEDFVREQDPSLPTMTLKKFSHSLFHVCPLLSHWGDDHEQTFQSFLAYKTRVPVCGAIMLNEARDKVRGSPLVACRAVMTLCAVSACERLESHFCLELAEREDQ